MGITRTAIVDDDGSGTTGTGLDAAWKTELYDQIDAADTTAVAAGFTPTASAPTTTGNQTALALPSTGSGPLVTHFNNATLTTIQGMVAGTHGQLWFQYSKGAGQVDYAHLHASGTALGKLKLFATSGLTSLAAGVGVAVFQYDLTVTQWRLVLHEQGDWITPAFDAAHYTGSGATNFSWTLAAGDRAGQAYWLRGRELTVTFSLDTTSVVASPAAISTDLRILNTGWGNFTGAALQYSGAVNLATDNAVVVPAFIQANASATYLRILKQSLAVWTAATNATAIYGTIILGVI